MKFSERLVDLKSAEEFCKMNNIKPSEVIIFWEEDIDENKFL